MFLKGLFNAVLAPFGGRSLSPRRPGEYAHAWAITPARSHPRTDPCTRACVHRHGHTQAPALRASTPRSGRAQRQRWDTHSPPPRPGQGLRRPPAVPWSDGAGRCPARGCIRGRPGPARPAGGTGQIVNSRFARGRVGPRPLRSPVSRPRPWLPPSAAGGQSPPPPPPGCRGKEWGRTERDFTPKKD